MVTWLFPVKDATMMPVACIKTTLTKGDYNFFDSDCATVEVYIIYDGPKEEEKYTSSISVDEQTLIGQGGGLLGILLGWSGMTLADLITTTLNQLIIPALYMLE